MKQEPNAPLGAASGYATAEHSPIYSYNFVKSELCDACRLKIPDTHGDGRVWHTVNGLNIPCMAERWRKSTAAHQAMESHNDIADRRVGEPIETTKGKR